MSIQKVFVSAIYNKGNDSFFVTKNEYQGYQAIRDEIVTIAKEKKMDVNDINEIKSLRFMASNIEESVDILLSFISENLIISDSVTVVIPTSTEVDLEKNIEDLYVGIINYEDVFVANTEQEIKDKGIEFVNEYWEAELGDAEKPSDPDELLSQYFSATNEDFSYGKADIIKLGNEHKPKTLEANM